MCACISSGDVNRCGDIIPYGNGTNGGLKLNSMLE